MRPPHASVRTLCVVVCVNPPQRLLPHCHVWVVPPLRTALCHHHHHRRHRFYSFPLARVPVVPCVGMSPAVSSPSVAAATTVFPSLRRFTPPPHLPLFGLMFCSANVSRWWCASARCLAWKSRTIAKRECCFIVLHAPSSTNSLPPFSLSLSLPQHHHRRSRCR